MVTINGNPAVQATAPDAETIEQTRARLAAERREAEAFAERYGLDFVDVTRFRIDNDLFRHSFLDWARSSVELAPAQLKTFLTAERDGRMNRWADHLRSSLRLELIRNWISPASAAAKRGRPTEAAPRS